MIGIITVNYNQYQQTEEFLDSLTKVKNSQKALVYITDLSSFKKNLNIKKYPFTVVVEKKENKGYAFGVNCGLRYFLNREINYFCVLNNDIFFDKNFLDEVEKTFKTTDIFGGKIYYAAGFEYHKKRYRKEDLGKVIWYAGGQIDWKNAFTFHQKVDEVDNGIDQNCQETEFITGCLLCFNKKVVEKVGFWDEKYFLYYEDADYCVRAKRAGFKLFYNPKIIIYHKNAQSTGGSGSLIQQEFQKKSQLIFGLKYAPFKTKFHLLKNYLFKK
ncbi:MAG: glycosyltransferase family 2 protein [Microgenomates group bacterium]|nr:glycosyltransferase family 2 protein [Microgenomates group bacterium]